MWTTGWPRLAGVALIVFLAAGCQPSKSDIRELTVAEAQHTLNTWNPSYAKVMEFYGFYYPDGNPQGPGCVAYVLLSNPADKEPRLLVYEAHFRRLVRPEGTSQWYLTGLISHSAGLTRRQGWDTLLIPVKAPDAAKGR